ncbi:metallophosphoesterase [Bacillus sp. FJAT-49711]|uniref:metallophosphoesterase family protein n=1 Tax=Bacillus sp. FJAT-49711 TaxID=2833585 RepID=UPI001BC8ED36|nr:metallophosphoesterase [Bacillus sp. FJAT-49711]MBS4217467.1 metallophosphoesterase [Bacillus sp. FJAT-49711]
MRIVVVGDFHIKSNELDLTKQAIEDIANCSPDLIIPLGDFGSYENIGSPEGLIQSFEYFSILNKKIRPILGNHDLERESGKEESEQGIIQREFKKLYNLENTYGVLEFNDFRLIFISTDPQPKHSCYEIQECYVSDEQYNWLVDILSKRPNIPVIMFTHAPPIGSGLRTVPGVHVRATNAFLDQNHDPYRWIDLIKSNPQIVMWFSAHFHLSHQYKDSHVENYGTTFFTTGVHGSATRDMKRQSRIIDLEAGKISVSTLDHNNKRILDQHDWSFDGSWQQLVHQKKNNLEKLSHVHPTTEHQTPVSLISSCSVGDKNGSPLKMIPFKRNHLLVATKDGFLWDLDTDVNGVLGTYHIGESLTSIAYSDETIWKAWDRYFIGLPANTPSSFVRRKSDELPANVTEMPHEIHAITPRSKGGIWICSGKSIYIHVDGSIEPFISLKEEIINIRDVGKNLLFQTNSGNIYQWTEDNSEVTLVVKHVVAWDVYNNRFIALLFNHSILNINLDTTEFNTSLTDVRPYSSPKILCVSETDFILAGSGQAMIWIEEEKRWHKLDTAKGKVTTLSRCLYSEEFALGLELENEEDFPKVQIWRCNLLRK